MIGRPTNRQVRRERVETRRDWVNGICHIGHDTSRARDNITYMLSRRDFLSSASAAAVSSAATQATGAATRKPNFIIFLADDLGCHDIGAWGAHDLKTPNIDALAA